MNEANRGPRPWLPVAGLVVAAWAMIPPYAGPALAVRPDVEVVDHVIPGMAVLATSASVFASTRLTRRSPRPTAMLAVGFVVLLAGFWMTATHVPLVQQLARDEVGMAAVAHHGLPGLAVLLVGLLWVATYWVESAPRGGAGGVLT